MKDWEARLAELMPLYGHRNWIVVADSAYPAQARPAIETVVAPVDQITAVERVMRAIRSSKHVRPIIYTDRELRYVDEADAPGISAYRGQLKKLFGELPAEDMPHEQLIAKLDEAASLFRVCIVKTGFTLPYTSVFFQLACAYWSAEAERRLRDAMSKTAA